MNQIYNFFWKLTALAVAISVLGTLSSSYMQWHLPSMFYPMVAYYYILSAISFFINIKGTQKEAEIGVWYYMAAIMIKLIFAAGLVILMAKLYPAQKINIIYSNFVLYPSFEALVIYDIYRRIRK